MVGIPRDALEKLLDRFLKRGVVLRVEKYPNLVTGPKDKYLVLLNVQFIRGGQMFHVLTTSQVESIPFPQFAVVVPKGTVAYFPLDTAIQCREVHSLTWQELADRYADGTLKFVGELPPEVQGKIDAILRTSRHLAPKVALEILP